MQQPAMLAMGAGIPMDTATVTRRRVAMQSVALGILEHFELGIAGLSVGAKLGGTISRCIKACQGRWLSVSTCSWLPCVRWVILELDSHEDNLLLQKLWAKPDQFFYPISCYFWCLVLVYDRITWVASESLSAYLPSISLGHASFKFECKGIHWFCFELSRFNWGTHTRVKSRWRTCQRPTLRR